MICPDAVKALLNQHSAMVILTHIILVWNVDALTSRVKKNMRPYAIFKILSAEINYNHWK